DPAGGGDYLTNPWGDGEPDGDGDGECHGRRRGGGGAIPARRGCAGGGGHDGAVCGRVGHDHNEQRLAHADGAGARRGGEHRDVGRRGGDGVEHGHAAADGGDHGAGEWGDGEQYG